MLELLYLLESNSWIYLRGTPKHPTIMRNMSLHTLQSFVKRGDIREALPNIDDQVLP